MNSIIAVALITSISTLAGASVSGYITLLVSRTHSNDQLVLANTDRMEQRSAAQRQIRRDAYVQFLNQFSLTERALDVAWRSKPPSVLADVPSHIEPVSAELDVLQQMANLVVLEGPGEVAIATQVLQTRLTLESVDVIDAAKKSNGNAPCLQDDEKFMRIRTERATAKGKMIAAAQEALNDESRRPILL
jgi:hypothetical protein